MIILPLGVVAGGTGGGGGPQTLQWTIDGYLMSNGTTAVAVSGEGQGYLGFDNFAAQNAATQLFVTLHSTPGSVDQTSTLGTVTSGGTLRVEKKTDATVFVEFTASGAGVLTPGGSGYYTYSGSVAAASATAPFTHFNGVVLKYYH